MSGSATTAADFRLDGTAFGVVGPGVAIVVGVGLVVVVAATVVVEVELLDVVEVEVDAVVVDDELAVGAITLDALAD
jgi:hypothetical protein